MAHLEDARRIEAVHRLVEDQKRRIGEETPAQSRASGASPRNRSSRGRRRAVRARLVRATPGCAPRPPGHARQQSPSGSRDPSGAGGTEALRRSPRPAPTPLPASRAEAGRAARRCRRSACVKPTSVRISVVLPAPFGPRKPNATPAGTVRSTLSTAARSPKRFVSAVASMTVSIPVIYGLSSRANEKREKRRCEQVADALGAASLGHLERGAESVHGHEAELARGGGISTAGDQNGAKAVCSGVAARSTRRRAATDGRRAPIGSRRSRPHH